MISLNYISFFILFMCFILFISGLMRLFFVHLFISYYGFLFILSGFGTGNSIKFLVHCYNYSLLYNWSRRQLRMNLFEGENRFGVPYLNLRTSKKSIKELEKKNESLSIKTEYMGKFSWIYEKSQELCVFCTSIKIFRL